MDYTNLKDITLDGYKIYGEGNTAVVYISEQDPSLIIKVFNKNACFDAIKKEYECSKNAEKLGIKIPETYDLVTVNKIQYGIFYKKLKNKISFSKAIHNEPEKLEEYSRLFARECKKFHQVEVGDVKVPSRKELMLKNIENFPKLSDEERKILRDFVNAVPDSKIVNHGDMHTGNCLMAEGKIYWIDLGELGYGHPNFDTGILACLFTTMCHKEFVQSQFHMTEEQLKKVWFYFAKEYFGNEDDNFPEIKARELAPYGMSLILCAPNNGIDEEEYMGAIKGIIAAIKA